MKSPRLTTALGLAAAMALNACSQAPRPTIEKTPTGVTARCTSIDACRTPEGVAALQEACKQAVQAACGDIAIDQTGPAQKQMEDKCEQSVESLLSQGGGNSTVQCQGTTGSANSANFDITSGK